MGFLGRELGADAVASRAETLDRVVVCGAGPVGLTAALVLARAGVPVTVLEKLDVLSGESRASTFHPPTLELLDELGLADRVVRDGLVAATTQFRDRATGPVATFDLGVLADETPFPYRVQLEQSKLTPMILDELRAGTAAGRYDVDVRFGHRVHRAVGRSDAVGGERVRLLVGTNAELVEMDAPWVVGTEGAHSAVRTSLGIELVGETYPERFLVVSVAEELHERLPDLAYVNYVADPDQWLVLLRTPDHWRVLVPIAGGEGGDPLDPDAVQALLRGVVDLGRAWEVLDASLYVVSRRVAATMRCGHVLLAGDAAHQNSPLGGMGMNSGIQDAVSLGRRLALVWSGGGEALLDEWDELRRRVATEFVQADSHANWLVLREPDPVRRAELQAELRSVAADPVRHAERMRRTAMLDAVRSSL